ncbi:MAG: ABC transporter substrate-binding protein [Hyphomicrobiales bacterium]
MRNREPCRFGQLAMLFLAAMASLASVPAMAQQSFTDWGWPQPYEKVSDKSIAWLKQKGWWPLGFAWQGPFSGQNTTNVVMDKAGLLTKRGLEVKFQAFAAGPDVNEAVASARMQVGNGGNFPFTSLLDRDVPVRAIAVVAPNLKHSTVVPLDSPLKSLADLKGSNPPATIGIVTGSSAEFYFTQAAEVVGLQIGKDVILKNMPPAEQLLMPRGIAAVVPWEPSVTIIVEDRKTGREIDTIFPYNFYEGMFYVRQELIDNVPDVVQAISDAFMEANLWIRRDPEKAADFLVEEPMLKNYGKALMLQQTQLYNNLYKPTSSYPFAKFWSAENERIAKWLKERNRLTKTLTAKDYEASFDQRFMDRTYEKLGWKLPTQPPFLPADWPGKIGQVPYPPYANVTTLKEQRPWPEPGDLVRPWTFAGKTYQP